MARLNVDEWEAEALERLSPMVADYYRSGSRSERTLRNNRSAYERWVLRHRVLVDVSLRTQAARILGHEVATPIAVAPTAFHRLAHDEGEVATARGAGAAGAAMILSTLSNSPVERVVAEASGPVFFQLYVEKDRGRCRALVDRVRAAGCKALVVTVDAAVLGMRERDVRNGFHLPDGLSMPNIEGEFTDVPAAAGNSGLADWVERALDPSLSFKDLEWLASVAGIPVVAKGVCRGDDAIRCVDHGAAGVVVSNHGGRQLDGGQATLDALPEVVESVDGRAAVWVDGGVRSGVDALIALALGADAVLVGRPVLWGLTLGGADGVREVLQLLNSQLDEAMALVGAPSLPDITRDLVRRA